VFGLQLFQHSLRLLFSNFGMALRVSVWFYVLGLALGAFLAFGLLAPLSQDNGELPGTFALAFLVMVVILGWAVSLLCIAWHRYILIEEIPARLVPSWQGRNVWGYFGRALAIGLLVMVAGAVLLMLAGPLLQIGGPLSLIVTVGLATLLMFLSLRLGLVLPAMAMGRPLKFAQSWQATQPVAGPVLVMALCMTIVNLLPELILSALALDGAILTLVLGLAAQWLALMISISALTTLYGTLIEQRPLP